VACLLAVAAVPMARGDDDFQKVGIRVAALAFVALVAAVVRGWHVLVPVAVALVAGGYAAELAIDDAPLDLAAPAVAIGCFFAAELAYWSLDERIRVAGDRGEGLRRAAFLALVALAIFLVASGLLALVDEVRARGVALDLVGALAAVGVLVAVVAAARRQPSSGS
jgi:hypothetical protein